MDGAAFTTRVDGGHAAVVHVAGDLDLASAPDLLSVLGGLDGDVELDCSGVEFMDAAGVTTIVRARNTFTARGSALVVVNPSPAVARILRLVDLDTVLCVRQDGEAR